MVELLQVIHILRPVVVGVNHGDVSRLIDALAEGEGIGGRLFAGQAVRARLVGGVFLLVVDDRVIDRIAVDQLEQVVRFLKGFLLAQRLGKQIDADVQPRLRCSARTDRPARCGRSRNRGRRRGRTHSRYPRP